MAKISVNPGFALDMRQFDFSSLYYGADYRFSTSIYRVTYSNGYADEFRGSGFTYNSSGEPTGGTITSYAMIGGGTRIAFIDGVKIKATDLVNAARTYGTSDDVKIIDRALGGNDAVSGGSFADVLYAGGGNDRVSGNGGNDRIHAGAGNDKIIGGRGADFLYGSSGADTFIYKTGNDSTSGPSGRDFIADFSRFQKDKIDLKAMDANFSSGGNQAFKFIGSQEFHEKAGELRYRKLGGDTIVEADRNGDGEADFAIAIDGFINLKASDFIL
ncbi:calcium-binding protein [Shinella sp.]|uniref:calcium-binding protein n=1 Tax=Shinella sp. TaxID=1870904 RepID=UPI003D2A5905